MSAIYKINSDINSKISIAGIQEGKWRTSKNVSNTKMKIMFDKRRPERHTPVWNTTTSKCVSL
jgi:hypothetical protein